MEKELILEYQSNCKINLGLQVLNKRKDDFHNLESIFVDGFCGKNEILIVFE